MLWFSFAWDCGLLDNNLIIPQYLLEIKELKMNDKAVIALVMAYGDHGCQLSNVEISQKTGINSRTVANIVFKLLREEIFTISVFNGSEKQRSLIYNIYSSNIVLTKYVSNIVQLYDTISKRKQNKFEISFSIASSIKKIHQTSQTKEKVKAEKNHEFEEFWRSYPKQSRLNKSRCYLLYFKALELASAASLHTALEGWKQGKLWKEGFVCHCQKWLNQEYYLNVPDPYDDSWSKMW